MPAHHHSSLLNVERPNGVQCYTNLCKLIPGGVNSPVRSFKGMGIEPMIVERGVQDMIYDLDGNAYIDYCGSWGPLIHGHAHPEIVAVAQERIAKGSTFGIMTRSEELLAQAVIKHVPSIDKVRFVSSGTEATMSAARLARGYTGRDKIVKFSGNFHGHADLFLVQAGSGVFGLTPSSSSEGIPNDVIRHTACLPYNDIDACRQFLLHPDNTEQIAAVIVEPIAANMGCVPPKSGFLEMLREVTSAIGAVLIFDEVITGFRIGIGGAQALYGITPDLTCLGKIIGGGFPAAAFGGREDIMDCLAPLGHVYQAGTLSGNPVAMEAGLKAVQLLERKGFYEELEQKTRIITQPVSELLCARNINGCLQQIGSLFTVFFGRRQVSNMQEAQALDAEAFARFFRYMFAQGVYIPPLQYEAWFVSMAHEKKHLEKTRDLMLSYFEQM